MYQPSDAFRHEWHASSSGAGIPCYRCHAPGEVRSAATAAKCDACHSNLIPAAATIEVKQYHAVGYVEAMHRLCFGCHADSQCATCHTGGDELLKERALALHQRTPAEGRVILPPSDSK
jgi:hypothetical protein